MLISIRRALFGSEGGQCSTRARPTLPPPEPQAGVGDRAVVIDCETTGLSPNQGDRIVSFAGIELVDGAPTGRSTHLYFNPGRRSHFAARRVHGLSDTMLSFQPPFAAHAVEIEVFLRGAVLVGHNIKFDIAFLENEMRLAGRPPLRAPTICTMAAFRASHPGHGASLDSACTVLGIDASHRAAHHGAFVDANLTCVLYQAIVLGKTRCAMLRNLEPQNFVSPPAPRRRP